MNDATKIEAVCTNISSNTLQKSCTMIFPVASELTEIRLFLDSKVSTLKITLNTEIASTTKFTHNSYVAHKFDYQVITLTFDSAPGDLIKNNINCGNDIPLTCSEDSDKKVFKCRALLNRIGSFPVYFGGINTNQDIIVEEKNTPGIEEDSSVYLYSISIILLLFIF